MKDSTIPAHTVPARTAPACDRRLVSLGAIDPREAARRSGWIAETARRDRPVTFNSAV